MTDFKRPLDAGISAPASCSTLTVEDASLQVGICQPTLCCDCAKGWGPALRAIRIATLQFCGVFAFSAGFTWVFGLAPFSPALSVFPAPLFALHSSGPRQRPRCIAQCPWRRSL